MHHKCQRKLPVACIFQCPFFTAQFYLCMHVDDFQYFVVDTEFYFTQMLLFFWCFFFTLTFLDRVVENVMNYHVLST